MAIRFPDITREQLDAELAEKADWTPTVIADGASFHVPDGKQVLYRAPLMLEGDAVVQIDGVLLEVD